MPKRSAMPTRTLGAYCTTTLRFLSCSMDQNFSVSLRMVIAPVGHTDAHWPQPTQSVSLRVLPKSAEMCAFLPRPLKSTAPMFWISAQVRTHNPQRMHLLGSRTMLGEERSIGSVQ